ncbi:MAG: hypothetical protein KDB14_12810 [Planctomycetales bacterium]|nr:hypothetical protein [Planctomycetales bacterium]
MCSANDATLKAEIERLFDAHWEAKSSRDRESGDADFRRAQAAMPDWRLLYAQALVQVAQYRNGDAGETVRELLQIRKDDWRLYRTRAWLALAARDYEAGLVALDHCIRHLPAVDPKDPLDVDGREAVGDVGRMFAFLEVAVPQETDATTRDRFRRRWAMSFDPHRNASFESARNQVQVEHAKIESERDAIEKAGQEKAAKEKDEKLKSLDAQQADIASQQDKLRKDAESMQAQLKSELQTWERDDLPLRVAAGKLDAQAVSMDRDLAILASDIARLQRRLDFARDPVLRAQLIAEIRRLELIASRRDAELLGVERELDVVAAQRRLLLDRRQRAEADLGRQLDRAKETMSDLGKLDRRLSSQRQRVLRANEGSSGSMRALTIRARVVATYISFPLLEEKQRLLKLLSP